MSNAYSSFDTLSLEWSESTPVGVDAQEPALPVLARIPAIVVKDCESDATVRQLDSAHLSAPSPKSNIQGLAATVFEIRSDVARAVPLAECLANDLETEDQNAAIAPLAKPSATANAAEAASADDSTRFGSLTESIDTSQFDESQTVDAELATELDEPRDWLTPILRIEAMIAPYSQIIVLITLLTAAGLTALLLRSEPATFNDGNVTPSSDLMSAPAFSSVTPSLPTLPSLDALEQPAVAEASNSPVASPRTMASASGPVSASGIRNGEANSPAIGPIEPYRESSGRTRVALNPLPAPKRVIRTNGSDAQPRARLSSIRPYEERTK